VSQVRDQNCGNDTPVGAREQQREALQLSSSETETRSKRARQFGFTLVNAYLAARVNSL
jgi:hypothetical protein